MLNVLVVVCYSQDDDDDQAPCLWIHGQLDIFELFKDVRANCFCASLLRTRIHATSCVGAHRLSNKQ